MPHPIMFEDDDPHLLRLREIALAYPGAGERVGHGRPTFHTAKVFAYYGGSVKVDGTYEQHDHSLLFLPDKGERTALEQDPRVYRPAYLGPSGWLGLDLDADTDWGEVAELVDASYRRTAGKRLIAQLDGEASAPGA